MVNKLLTNWTFTRGLYLGIGLIVMIQSLLDHQWFGVVFGGYFASMGLFAFGCAAGNCVGGNCETTHKQTSKSTELHIEPEQNKIH